MDNKQNHMRLVYKSDRKKLKPYAQKLIDKDMLETIVGELSIQYKGLGIKNFRSSQTVSNFSLVINQNKKTFEVKCEIEMDYSFMYIAFDGSCLPENIRVLSSQIILSLWERIRFRFPEKNWIFGDYCILTLTDYYKRVEPSYAVARASEWIEMYHHIVEEGQSLQEDWLGPVSGAESLFIYITGLDGYNMAKTLEAEGILVVEQVDLNLYMLDWVDQPKTMYDSFKQKMLFVEKMVKEGFNIWLKEKPIQKNEG
ncbi:hypothetical protein bcgnr5378_36660 [Bacillus cereus]|uniref:Uncharacterized protein n=1 Tax=Bacillus cereus TaxID=1396 RepID=A0A164QPL2_BACCE|nr:hypothetical protein [Bacillus cereus]KZD72000.1 hypothetical protein B4088_0461 [Bacillus cereus]HDR8320374.1 hypothetical protein [Bacillus cereus]HDR8331247.1 hypothetical protein [Bacillus cereus]HDR8334236.1 hypothetical protein [Bacillus cereus]